MNRGPFGIPAATAWILTLLITAFGAQAEAQPTHAAAQVDWTQYRFDAAHDGFNSFETKIRPKTVQFLRFGFGLEGNFVASPVVVSGIVDLPYAGRIDGMSADGALLWSTRFKEGVIGRPAGSDGSIYVPTTTALYQIDAATGAVTDTWPGIPSSGDLVLTDDTVYAHTTSQLMAFDRQSHQVRWTHVVSGEATPAVSGGIVYEPISSSQLEALDASTGAVVWGPVTSAGNPSVGDGMVFTNRGGTVRAFDALTGDAEWDASIASDAGSPAVANGTVYVVTGDHPGSVDAFDDATGTLEWTTKISGHAWGTNITVTNGLVFASVENGVHILNKRGIELTRLVTGLSWQGGSEATVANGHVYFYGCGKRCAFAGWGV